jgi:branched-chain amino acid transport system permease protein
MTVILFTLVGVLGLTVLTGFTGLISLGHVGFLMLGAYAYAIGVSHAWACRRAGAADVHRGAGGLRAGRRYAFAAVARAVPGNHYAGLQPSSSALILSGGKFTGRRPRHHGARPKMAGHQTWQVTGRFTSSAWRCAVLAVLVTLNLRRTHGARAGGHPRQRHRRAHHGHQPVDASSCWPSC